MADPKRKSVIPNETIKLSIANEKPQPFRKSMFWYKRKLVQKPNYSERWKPCIPKSISKIKHGILSSRINRSSF